MSVNRGIVLLLVGCAAGVAVTALILTGVDGDGRAPLSPGDTVEVTAPNTTDTDDTGVDASVPTTGEAAVTSVATPVATIRPFVGTTVALAGPTTTTTTTTIANPAP